MEDNIKMNLTYMHTMGGVNVIHLAPDRSHWQACVAQGLLVSQEGHNCVELHLDIFPKIILKKARQMSGENTP